MACTINASTTNGIVQTADGSGVLQLQSSGTTIATISSSGLSSTTNAKAWVNFNGTGTVAIRSSYNVSSITDNGTGDYTVNFATALADANYCAIVKAGNATVTGYGFVGNGQLFSTSSYRFTGGFDGGGNPLDTAVICVAIFGN